MMNIKSFFVFSFLLIFASEVLFSQEKQIATAQSKLAAARATLKDAQKLQDSANYIFSKAVSVLNRGSNADLPIFLPFDKNLNTQENAPYQLKLSSVEINPYGASANIFMKLNSSVFSPNTTGAAPIYFGAENVAFTRSGGFTGETQLYLLSQMEINLGTNAKLIIYPVNEKKNTATYVEFSCNGFEKLYLSAAIEFNSNLVVKEDSNGKKTTEPMLVEFQMEIQDLNDWVIEIKNIPAFQFVNLPDFSWKINTLVYDNSLNTNSEYMQGLDPKTLDLRDGYFNPTWKGFYGRQAVVKMPKYLRSKKSKGERTALEIKNIFVDDETGFCAGASLKPVYEDGAIGAWKYTVAEMDVVIKDGIVNNFKMNGIIDMPIAKEAKKENDNSWSGGLGYTGEYVNSSSGRKLVLAVTQLQTYDFSFFKSVNVDLINPQLELTIGEDQIQGAFIIGTAKMKIAPTTSKDTTKSKTNFFEIKVNQLRIQSQKAYMSFGSAEIDGSSSKLAKLPIQLSDIRVMPGEDRIGLGMKISVLFMGSSNGFGGSADVNFFAKRNVETNRWKFDGMTVSQVCIGITGGAYSIKGCVSLVEADPVYGDCFSATLEAKFVKKIEVNVMALFGKIADSAGIPGYRYWYIDAGVELPTAIPIFPAVGISGFYGGAYFNMTLCPPPSIPTPNPPKGCDKGCTPNALGCNSSLLRFVPYKPDLNNDRLGIRAGLSIVSVPTAAAFSGKLAFGVEFTIPEFSIKKVTFNGRVQFVNTKGAVPKADQLKKVASKEDSTAGKTNDCIDKSVAVNWDTQYDIEKQIFAGAFRVDVLFEGIIKGTAGSCTAGDIEVYISPQKWYVYIGHPQRMNGLNLFDVFVVKSYVVMGSEVPGMAPLPNGIPSLAPLDDSMMKRGAGFGFGLRVEVAKHIGQHFDIKFSEKISCGIGAYVDFTFGAGVDVLLAKYEIPDCEVGINKWYATGQAYIYAKAGMGGDVGCDPIKASGSFAELSIAAAMLAQLPNPTYIAGLVQCKVTVVGISSGFKLDFKFGKQIKDHCNGNDGMQPNYVKINIIKQIYPSVVQDRINGYSGIQLTLTAGVGTAFPFNKPSAEDNTVGIGGVNVVGTPIIDNIYYYDSIGPGKDKLRRDLKLDDYFIRRPADAFGSSVFSYAPKKVLPAGQYSATVKVNVGTEEEIVNIQFTVEEESNTIPMNNVLACYPLPKMANFYRKTGKSGYIQLKSLPSKPVKYRKDHVLAVKFYEGDKIISSQKVTFDSVGVDNFKFNIPSNDFKNGTTYILKIVHAPEKFFTFSKNDTTKLKYSNLTPEVFHPEIDSLVILEYPFTTSQFSSFEEKMQAFASGKPKTKDNFLLVPLASNSAFGTEEFSDAELEGPKLDYGGVLPPLIRLDPGNKISNDSGLNMEIKDGKAFPKGYYTSNVNYYLPGKTIPEITYRLNYNYFE